MEPITFENSLQATTGTVIKQPIAGDFGMNIEFINSILEDADEHVQQYGINVFITSQAV